MLPDKGFARLPEVIGVASTVLSMLPRLSVMGEQLFASKRSGSWLGVPQYYHARRRYYRIVVNPMLRTLREIERIGKDTNERLAR